MRNRTLLKTSLIGSMTLLASGACSPPRIAGPVDQVVISRANRSPASDPCTESPWEARWRKGVQDLRESKTAGPTAVQKTFDEIIPLQDVLARGPVWLSSRFGRVASQVVNRDAVRSSLPQSEASVIPFYYFDRFLREATLPSGARLSQELDQILTGIAEAPESEVEASLGEGRRAIEQADIPEKLLRQIDGKLSQSFPDRRVRMKFYPSRSETAALPEPETDSDGLVVCPADTLLTSRTSACRGLYGPEPVARALKRVWAEAFSMSTSVARTLFKKAPASASVPPIAIFMHAACSTGVDRPGRARE